ncbi:MAG: hypothetical protein JXA68_00425 [Ignavibacteriales bacterium]|nr:hypothetical protein [Ignavibacteriales bacterium]
MNVQVELKLKKKFIDAANMTGEFKIEIVNDAVSKSYVVMKLVEALDKSGFKGKINIDGEEKTI